MYDEFLASATSRPLVDDRIFDGPLDYPAIEHSIGNLKGLMWETFKLVRRPRGLARSPSVASFRAHSIAKMTWRVGKTSNLMKSSDFGRGEGDLI